MKTYKWKLKLFRTAVVLVGAFAWGAVSAQTISGTKHDLGSGGSAPVLQGQTAEVCVFCHTPHGSDNSASVPLWNKTLNATPATTYTTYDSLGTSSQDGEVVDVGSVSIACLSCHDGTQAMDNMLNEPGSGAQNTFATTLGAMTGPNNGIAMLGTDLRNDHPIGIQYAGGGSGGTLVDQDFKAPTSGTANGTTIWWVSTDANTTREKTDLPLYNRELTVGSPEPFVECASCHDPHEDTNATFLRVANDNSDVCLACHTK